MKIKRYLMILFVPCRKPTYVLLYSSSMLVCFIPTRNLADGFCLLLTTEQ